MKKFSFIYVAKATLLILLTVGFIASCSNSTENEEDPEQEPVGLIVKQNGQTVIGQNASGITDGPIELTVGVSTTFTIVFVDEDGEEFTPEPEEHGISVDKTPATLAVENIMSDSEPFSFDLTASAEGSGSITITLTHEGASEFVSNALSVNVSPTP